MPNLSAFSFGTRVVIFYRIEILISVIEFNYKNHLIMKRLCDLRSLLFYLMVNRHFLVIGDILFYKIHIELKFVFYVAQKLLKHAFIAYTANKQMTLLIKSEISPVDNSPLRANGVLYIAR